MFSIDLTVTTDEPDPRTLARAETEVTDLEHIPMALMRAITGACLTAGVPTPAEAAGQLSDNLKVRDAAFPEWLTKAFEHYGQGGVTSESSALMALSAMDGAVKAGRHGLNFLAALGDEFTPALHVARRTYALAEGSLEHTVFMSGRNPDALMSDQLHAVLDAVRALANLLDTLDKVDPEPDPRDGSTTHVVTQSIPIGQSALSRDAVPGPVADQGPLGVQGPAAV